MAKRKIDPDGIRLPPGGAVDASHRAKTDFTIFDNRLLLSEQFLELSEGASRLYFLLLATAKGKMTFEFPQNQFSRYRLSRSSARRYFDELETRGFLTIQHGFNTRSKNVYSFSLRWTQNTSEKSDAKN